MRCPACGHEESVGTVCSQCATPLPAPEEKPAPVAGSPSKPSETRSPIPPKEGKHRSRPLHDLDLTLPELEVQHLAPAQSIPRKETDQKEPGQEQPSFKVTDRRGRLEEAKVRAAPAPNPEAAAPASRSGPETRGVLDFSSFILSVGASALMAMGGAHVPGLPLQGSAPPVDLAQARELIDLLGMLEEKTKGNLSPEESELLQQTLYTLRIKFIETSKKT